MQQFKLLILLITLFIMNVQASDSNHMKMMKKDKKMKILPVSKGATIMHHGKKEKMDKSGRVMLDKKTTKQLLSVLEANEKLHMAFFKYNPKKIENKSKKVNKAISEISNKEISKLFEFSSKKLTSITKESTKDENNQSYHVFSMALIHVISKYDVGDKYNAYSCPMVKKKWVQNSKVIDEVHNPYAPEMPNCGSKNSKY
jgi:hypothetical protein